jgi:hypothetical protein
VTDTAAYLYPWDVDGDPAAARRIAGLGVPGVAVAAVYHDVRAITPFHPEHRIVTRPAGTYYISERRAPSPYAGSFERAARALKDAGLSVTAWVVVTHNETLAAARPDTMVRNAFGDSYPWALCCANPDVRDYAATVAAEVASLDCVDRVELEACGWYGFDHLSQHDKTGGTPSGSAGWLLDLCFCPSCEQAFAAAGLDPDKTRDAVRDAIDGGTPLPDELDSALGDVRAALAGEFLRETMTARRHGISKPVLVQTAPDVRAAGANPGFRPEDLRVADGVVVNCMGGGVAPVAGMPAGLRPAASLTAVAGSPVVVGGGVRTDLRAQAGALLAAGASGLRFYHAGLARAGDLAAIREVVAELG